VRENKNERMKKNKGYMLCHTKQTLDVEIWEKIYHKQHPFYIVVDPTIHTHTDQRQLQKHQSVVSNKKRTE
jgi:hypothetical protein